jgi:hypothetical protein
MLGCGKGNKEKRPTSRSSSSREKFRKGGRNVEMYGRRRKV